MQLRSFLTGLALALIGLVSVASVQAADKADPVGDWSWTTTAQNGNSITQHVRFKREGEKLTGVMMGRREGRETALEDVKLSGDEVSFSVTRERQGEKRVSHYKGKLAGDTIKGTVQTGDAKPRDWVAKRETKKD
jgi:hypothetical protein